MNKPIAGLAVLVTALMLGACNSAKGPAEAALASAESTFAAIHDTAQKYAPEQMGGVEAQLQSMKDAYVRGDYKAVAEAAPALTAALAKLKDAATARKEEMEAALAKAKEEWPSTSTAVPKMVDAIQARLDSLGKSAHLPKGVSKDSVAAARTGLATMKTDWEAATSAATSGDFAGAMAKAQVVRDEATKIMQSLGMSAG